MGSCCQVARTQSGRSVQNSMEGWADFVQDINQYYGVRMDCLSDHFHNEQRDYYLQTSAWVDTHPSQMLGPASCFKRYDLATVTLEELSAPLKVRPRPRESVSSSQHSSQSRAAACDDADSVLSTEWLLVSSCCAVEA